MTRELVECYGHVSLFSTQQVTDLAATALQPWNFCYQLLTPFISIECFGIDPR